MITIGEANVGKSNLINRLAKNEFYEGEGGITIGAGVEIVAASLDNMSIKAIIWDTAGQEKYRAFSQIYYRNAVVVLLTYDITSEESFSEVQYWLDDFRKRAGTTSAIIYLVGNKADLESEREVDF